MNFLIGQGMFDWQIAILVSILVSIPVVILSLIIYVLTMYVLDTLPRRRFIAFKLSSLTDQIEFKLEYQAFIEEIRNSSKDASELNHLPEFKREQRTVSKINESIDSNYTFERYCALNRVGDINEFIESSRNNDSSRESALSIDSVSGWMTVLEKTATRLNDENIFVRNAAALALARAGMLANFALSDLVSAMKKYSHEGAGMYSAEALGNIGVKNDTVLSALRNIGKNSDYLARHAARTAYTKLTGRSMLDE